MVTRSNPGSDLGRHPSTPSDLPLTNNQVRRFYEDGYLIIPQYVLKREVDHIRQLITTLFERFDCLPNRWARDLDVDDSHHGAIRNPEIGRCVRLEPHLRQTQYLRDVRFLARQLLGPEARMTFDHANLKPAHYGSSTQWHQDDAYNRSGGPALRANFWLPLHDATIESGCLHYIPRSHKEGIRPHRRLTHHAHALTTDQVDSHQAVRVPLEAGDLAIHHGRTLHFAGPNTTDGPRLAWVLSFGVGGWSVRAQLMRVAGSIGQVFLGWPKRPALRAGMTKH